MIGPNLVWFDMVFDLNGFGMTLFYFILFGARLNQDFRFGAAINLMTTAVFLNGRENIYISIYR